MSEYNELKKQLEKRAEYLALDAIETLQSELTRLRDEVEQLRQDIGYWQEYGKEYKARFEQCVMENEGLRAERINERAAVPNGYVLVPIEPTKEMLDVAVSYALNVSVHGENGWSKYMATVYRRMLAAAPQPPSAGDRCDARR